MAEGYNIDVCPICRKQIHDVDGLSPTCYHEGAAIPGVRIPVAPTVDLDAVLAKPAREARKLIRRHQERERLINEEMVRREEFESRLRDFD